MNQQHKVYILFGPSGTGKTSIASILNDYGIPKIITTTTRQPRKGEIDGIHYNFVTRDQFEELDLLEFNEHSGHLYGTTESNILDAYAKNKVSIIIVDHDGVQSIKQAFPEFVESIFIMSGFCLAVDRMRKRGDKDEEINARIEYENKIDIWSKMNLADHTIRNDGSLLYAVDQALTIMGLPIVLPKVS